jgi:hypothetical protein
MNKICHTKSKKHLSTFCEKQKESRILGKKSKGYRPKVEKSCREGAAIYIQNIVFAMVVKFSRV